MGELSKPEVFEVATHISKCAERLAARDSIPGGDLLDHEHGTERLQRKSSRNYRKSLSS